MRFLHAQHRVERSRASKSRRREPIVSLESRQKHISEESVFGVLKIDAPHTVTREKDLNQVYSRSRTHH